MTISLTDDVEWINECYEYDERHEHVSVYLIQEEDKYILIDSGSFYHRQEIKSKISQVTAGAGIDALILSHSDYPHSANISEFRSEWDNVELIASSGNPPAQGLSDATKCEIGGSMEIEGRKFSFIDPPLADRSHTTWIYDQSSRVLFTADGFGNYHYPNECTAISSALDNGDRFEDIYQFHKETLVWLRYVDPEKLRTVLESILEEYPPNYIAPVHGNPITQDDLDQYLDQLIMAANKISDEYTVPNRA
jgi:flavorubredoxin